MTTVYGGTDGVKLFLKNQIMESVYRFGDSGHEIVSMEVQNLYSNKKSAIKDYSFRETKMYGTIFNYLGYMTMLVTIMVVVFPDAYLTHYTTQMKKKTRKRIAKLIMKNIIDDLGVVREDEGCCITQTATLCHKRKVIYYALGFKHKLFETNKDTTPKNNLSRLIFTCANNHLYTQLQMKNKEKLYSKHVPK